MIKSIIYNINELRKPCLSVEKKENISYILQDLKDTLYSLQEKKHGLALAANQIGYFKKIALIRIPLNKEWTKFNEYFIINPVIIEKNRKIVFPESCLSFPGLIINTDRYIFITIEFENEKRKLITHLAQDLEGIILQHEVSHLQGKVMMDFKHRNKR